MLRHLKTKGYSSESKDRSQEETSIKDNNTIKAFSLEVCSSCRFLVTNNYFFPYYLREDSVITKVLDRDKIPIQTSRGKARLVEFPPKGFLSSLASPAALLYLKQEVITKYDISHYLLGPSNHCSNYTAADRPRLDQCYSNGITALSRDSFDINRRYPLK